MSTDSQEQRRERLQRIADEYTESIYDAETSAELAGDEPVAPFAAVTSEGSPDSAYASNGDLFVCGTVEELSDRLAGQIAEGWFSHGRIWDLRTDEFDIGGNVGAQVSVSIELPDPYDADRVYCPECKGPAEPGSRNRVSATHVEYRCAAGHGFFGVREEVAVV